MLARSEFTRLSETLINACLSQRISQDSHNADGLMTHSPPAPRNVILIGVKAMLPGAAVPSGADNRSQITSTSGSMPRQTHTALVKNTSTASARSARPVIAPSACDGTSLDVPFQKSGSFGSE